MKRSDVDAVKAECARLLERIATMERAAGWHRREADEAGEFHDKATLKPHPDDVFNAGQDVAAVKRARLDLQKALQRIAR
ncbi:hypothetical protein [Comamonas serinivorans]|uniref:hypothetical protein n=1 Tax=Comamonas serinivorans TaxID=1082851 RepID=UPI0012FCECAA|nr:hypothetical protein [Comamonas serinivorans]